MANDLRGGQANSKACFNYTGQLCGGVVSVIGPGNPGWVTMAGPVVMVAPPHGDGGHGVHGAHWSPRHRHRETRWRQRQPTEGSVIITIAVRISNFFIIVSPGGRNADTEAGGDGAPNNSTPHTLMCKRNTNFFFVIRSKDQRIAMRKHHAKTLCR